MVSGETNGQRPTQQRTAYLGPEASFSHQAAVEALPHTVPIPLPSFKAILQGIQDSGDEAADAYDYAVLPVENSTNGSVVQALDLVAQCGLTSAYSDVEVIDEYYLEVHHNLFVSRIWAEQKLDQEDFAALPIDIEQATKQDTKQQLHNGSSTSEVPSNPSPMNRLNNVLEKLETKTLHTHPQVWGQCNNILSTYLPPGNVDRVDMSSTSAAAAFIADSSHSSQDGLAAISSSLAGTKHANDLVCIARNIEDEPGENTTRFLVLKNRKRSQACLPLHEKLQQGSIQIKSLWAFTIAHFVPGTLATTLSVFAKHNFNLSAIQSRPRPKQKILGGEQGHVTSKRSQDNNWRYIFFVECLHQRDAALMNQGDEELGKLLKELESVTEQISLLGSWKNRLC